MALFRDACTNICAIYNHICDNSRPFKQSGMRTELHFVRRDVRLNSLAHPSQDCTCVLVLSWPKFTKRRASRTSSSGANPSKRLLKNVKGVGQERMRAHRSSAGHSSLSIQKAKTPKKTFSCPPGQWTCRQIAVAGFERLVDNRVAPGVSVHLQRIGIACDE